MTGIVLRALKKMFTRPIAEETPSATNSNAPDLPTASFTVLPPLRSKHEPVVTVLEDDAIIEHFEPLLVHCPKNTKVLEMLAEAYARKRMFVVEDCPTFCEQLFSNWILGRARKCGL